MEVLQEFIKLVKELPDLAVYLVIGWLLYQSLIVGSIYGCVKLGITKLHDAVVFYKEKPPEVKTVEIRSTIDGICIKGQADPLIAQIHRLVGKGVSINSQYIHADGVQWLREAINEKEAREREDTELTLRGGK